MVKQLTLDARANAFELFRDAGLDVLFADRMLDDLKDKCTIEVPESVNEGLYGSLDTFDQYIEDNNKLGVISRAAVHEEIKKFKDRIVRNLMYDQILDVVQKAKDNDIDPIDGSFDINDGRAFSPNIGTEFNINLRLLLPKEVANNEETD